MKQVVQLDDKNYFVGITTADESPLEPGVFLLPAGCVDADPPELREGFMARWDDGWVYEPVPEPDVVEPEEPTLEQKASTVRSKRDRLLAASDWAALPDVPASDEWLTYRQALRDVPQQSGFPDSVEWPTPPNE